MTVRRMDHVGIVVEDLDAAVAFFEEIGLEPLGSGEVGGDWVDRVIGLQGVRSRIAMLQTPDGHSRVELSEFFSPESPVGDERTPTNVPGIRHLAFLVDDLDDVLGRLRSTGTELVGEVEQYEDVYRLCYVRGPAGAVVELAEEVR